MIELSLGEIAAIVGGRLVDADPDAPVTGSVEYDSRKIDRGGLFVAFAGEHVDGHDFAAAAHAAGAVASLVTRSVPGPRIEVADPLAALAALASAVVRRLPDVSVVGITGSSGKTSTKDLLGQLLARLGPTVAPAGSLNNELGFPYTVLRADESTRYLVLEMGARGIGHIAHLAGIAAPKVGVVLNVGSAHMGEFGSREAIARAKGELVEALPADGMAVLNADDPLVAAMAAHTAARVVTFGEGAGAHVRAAEVCVDELGRASFDLRAGDASAPVRLRVVGAHQVSNALAAAAVALDRGLGLAATAEALGAATAVSRWRMELTERADGVLVVNDAYNANPESTAAALKALAALATPRRAGGARSFAVLGQMAELGSVSREEHDAIGRLAVRLDISRLIAVGEQARPIAHGAALEGSWNGESSWVPDAEAAISMLRAQVRPGDVVLVKASRAVGLEQVALALAAGEPLAANEPLAADEAGGGAA
jgi:UDP-N-acetylmuramoyl-tripeptide--D-alanyl-D-alanine ligase